MAATSVVAPMAPMADERRYETTAIAATASRLTAASSGPSCATSRTGTDPHSARRGKVRTPAKIWRPLHT